jgi:small-conductance mechanosensitive channel
MDLAPLAEWWSAPRMEAALRAVVLALAALVLASLAAHAVQRLAGRRLGAQQLMLARRAAYYGVLGVMLASALRELGFNLGVLLGAAGVLTIAAGFAAQTSASNLISGLFLIGERAFQVGDLVRIGSLTGEVLSVDLLSVKLRTLDNLYVRVPNETLIKSELTNLSRFPIRRLDLLLSVDYGSDIAQVEALLREVAHAHPLCLEEPAPLFIFRGFGESALDLQFSVWAARQNYLELGNDLRRDIKVAFDAAGVQIPYPHRTVLVRGMNGGMDLKDIAAAGAD